MKIYFIEAKYTDGIYKIDDFFVGFDYKQDSTKMQDIDIKTNDGATVTIVNTLLPDGTNVNKYTHVLVPDAGKIYEIERCVFINNTQTQINLIEDAFIGNYHTVKHKQMKLERTNDQRLFKGIHDVEDISVRPTLETKGTGVTYTGQWVLYFIDPKSFSYSSSSDRVQIYVKLPVATKDNNETYATNDVNLTYFDSIDNYKSKYPEIVTSDPLSINYFNKSISSQYHDRDAISIYHRQQIKWNDVRFNPQTYQKSNGQRVDVKKLSIHKIDVNDSVRMASNLSSIVMAFPLERNIALENSDDILIPYSPGVSEAITSSGMIIRDVKIVNESQIFNQNTIVEYNHDWPYVNSATNDLRNTKIIKNNKSFYSLQANVTDQGYELGFSDHLVFDNNAPDTIGVNNQPNRSQKMRVLILNEFNPELKVDVPTGDGIFNYEPFKRRTVAVFGKEYPVAYKNIDSIRIRFAVSMNQIEYFGYINNDLSQKLFSDSYSTGISWSMDQLDLFNQQNPTYKDQYNANMLRKGLGILSSAGKGAAAGALAGGPIGGGVGALAGAGLGIGMGLINMGTDMNLETLRQKGLDLAPEQMFGDGSNIGLASQSKYGVFVNTYISDFVDSMKVKYDLSGFPTNQITTLNNLGRYDSDTFGYNSLAKGFLVETVKNKFITQQINDRLQKGVILI